MNVQEQHIEIRQGLNQIGANRNKKYEDEEIDWIINRMQDRYIRSCLRPKDNGGFEVDQLKADDISPLIVSNTTLVPYINGSNRYQCFLPPNYQYLLSDGSTTKKLCGSEVPKVVNRNLYLTAVRQDVSVKSTKPFYVTSSVIIKNNTISIPTNLPYQNTYTGFNSLNDIFSFLVPYIAEKGGWYWERVADYEYPLHYIRLSETAGTGDSGVTTDGTSSATVVERTLSMLVHTNSGGTFRDNRLTGSHLLYSLNTNPIYKTGYYSPISEIIGKTLYVYRDTNFIISDVRVSYVRKPRIISLSLNTSSELPRSTCQVVCNLAVEYIKGRLENTAGQQIAERDIDKRVTL
jgi:hypothetical protein